MTILVWVEMSINLSNCHLSGIDISNYIIIVCSFLATQVPSTFPATPVQIINHLHNTMEQDHSTLGSLSTILISFDQPANTYTDTHNYIYTYCMHAQSHTGASMYCKYIHSPYKNMHENTHTLTHTLSCDSCKQLSTTTS